LIAFIELLCIGLAVAKKADEGGKVVITSGQVYDVSPLDAVKNTLGETDLNAPRSVEEILSSVPDIIPGQVSYRVAQASNGEAEDEESLELNVPLIADPKIERLFLEARDAFVAGDMRKSLLKLEESIKQEPKEPNLLYMMGTCFEVMGQFAKASDYYQRVIELGSDAGALYPLAAGKLTEGFTENIEMLGLMSLGRVRKFKDSEDKAINKIFLTIPVYASSKKEVDATKVELKVRVFDKNRRGAVVEALPQNAPFTEWTTGIADWAKGTEEVLRATYSLPSSKNARSLEERKYFGYVVELFYEGVLIDLRAEPRMLFSKVNTGAFRDGSGEVPFQNILDFPIEDSNPYNPLLPPLPRK